MISPTPEPPLQLLDISAPMLTGIPTLWVYIGFLLLALLLIYGLFCLLRKKTSVVVLPLSPYEQSLKSLEKARGWIAKHHSKKLAIALSDCIRFFLEKQFHLPILEKTTEEFFAQENLQDCLPEESITLFKEFCQTSDLVKFAKKELSPSEMENFFLSAQEFLQKTYQATLQASEQPEVSPKKRGRKKAGQE